MDPLRAFTEHPASVGESYFGHLLQASRFGLRMIAEGVENAEQAAVLHALGVEYLQGNALGKADEAPHIEALDPVWLADAAQPLGGNMSAT